MQQLFPPARSGNLILCQAFGWLVKLPVHGWGKLMQFALAYCLVVAGCLTPAFAGDFRQDNGVWYEYTDAITSLYWQNIDSESNGGGQHNTSKDKAELVAKYEAQIAPSAAIIRTRLKGNLALCDPGQISRSHSVSEHSGGTSGREQAQAVVTV